MEIVFVMDTSGSMRDEADALCAGISQVIADLNKQGVFIRANFLGITQISGGSFSCLTDHVLGLLGGTVPGDAQSCPFPDGTSAYESWGPATAIVAERFPWMPDATRLVVPISDEGPCNGSRPEGCNDPGDDRDSIVNAITIALANNVVISPIAGTGSDACVINLAAAAANGTKGTYSTRQLKNPKQDLFDSIERIVFDQCDVDDRCNDQQPCTVLDNCDGTGRCQGTDIGTVSCTSNADCFGLTCDLANGFCVCENSIPEICLNATSASLPEAGCFSVGDDLFVTIGLGSSSRTIVGGQFLIAYNPTVLEFIDLEAGAFADPDSPFGFELVRTINQSQGTIFYAVGISPGTDGTHGPAMMAKMRFRPLQACSTDELCFLSKNPADTILVDDHGHPVPSTSCCTGELVIHDEAPVLHCPQDQTVNADPDTSSATVTWPSVTAGGECDGELLASCSGTNSSGDDLSPLASTGGTFPSGAAEFACTATDSCGVSTTCRWKIEVRNENTVEVHVQLSPVVSPNLLRRCIVFEFFSTCDEPPTVVEQTLDFGGLFNFPGTAGNVTLKVPAGQYGCVTARDPRHTLRSASLLHVVNGKYVARFAGDPRYGGNWLLGGNLNGDRVIDLLDQALLLAQYSATLNPNTPCGTGSQLHADLNGNGIVDSNDLGFIQRNFLASDKGACCPDSTSGAEMPAPSEISLEELDALGLGHLRAADSDDDGTVNAEQIMLFLQGPGTGAQGLQPNP